MITYPSVFTSCVHQPFSTECVAQQLTFSLHASITFFGKLSKQAL